MIGCLVSAVTSECVIESVVSGVGLGISIYTCAKKRLGVIGLNMEKVYCQEIGNTPEG